MSAQLNHALLRPPILHILRAAGFHSARPSVIDTLTDIAARYLLLLAATTAAHAANNHDEVSPTITDVRMAMQDCGVFAPALTATEEAWKEALRRPLAEYPERNGLRAKERARRDAEDTRDVREFMDWVRGDQNAEIRRIAGLVASDGQNAEIEALVGREDFLTVLKKKHSKTGEESRYRGTVLGKAADDKVVTIEGGPVDSVEAWNRYARELSAKLAADTPNTEADTQEIEMKDVLGEEG